MVAVASATKARPLAPNLPSHRDPYYAGKWQKPKSDRYVDAISPGTGESLGKVVDGSAADAEAAIAAAKAAFREWRRVLPLERAKMLRAIAIDRAARVVATASGRRYPYDALVLATGSLVRELPQLPLGMARVHYLRTEADARALAAALRGCRQLVVVGGGLIGLEAAASARELGVNVIVLEVAPRILARVCDAETSAFIADEHRRHGVDLRTGITIAAA